MSRWREILIAEQRKLPRGATFKQRGEATKRASRIYRGQELRQNPEGKQLVKYGLIAAGVYALYVTLRPQVAAPVPTTPANAGAPLPTR